MYLPKQETYYVLPEGSYDDSPSLNSIATEFYGKQYVGQQVGDGGEHGVFSNESSNVFDMDEEIVEDILWELKDDEPRAYLGYNPFEKETKYHIGHNQEEYWKSLSFSDDPEKVTHPNNPMGGEDCYGAVFRYDFQVYREAPDVRYTLARLIKAEVLPYGKYLLTVSW